ncbi:MAG TPA: FkbM family methyltransferase [Xanthobacteraceae bacterium]|nr:FkbM family methyltransferase [Xanthobacteraceae bacterium]
MRLAWLRSLGAIGVKNFKAGSGLGYDFVCHIGDLAEFPFYHRRAFEKELALCAAWLRDEPEPVVYDIGANVGFVSTHLAQMLAGRSPKIYAFEPMPTTFARLVKSVQRLGLNEFVHPIAAAVIDESRPVCVSFPQRNSLMAHVVQDASEVRAGEGFAYAVGITLDQFYAGVNARPALLKIDVEGSEVAVLRGARDLLSRHDRPALIFEYNPITLAECGATVESLRELLSGYAFYYVDDLDGQKLPFGSAVADIRQLRWICNLFALPLSQASSGRWGSALKQATSELVRRGS